VTIGFVVPWFGGLEAFVAVLAAVISAQHSAFVDEAASNQWLLDGFRLVDGGINWMQVCDVAQSLVPIANAHLLGRV
jgi:hypothetical protein